MADIVTYSVNELTQDEDYKVFLYVLQNKKKYENFEKKFKQALLTEMKNQGVTSFSNDNISVVYKKPSVRRVVDTEKLKEQGLYDSFTKESQVSESVAITIKNG